jgi:hypothetical protein
MMALEFATGLMDLIARALRFLAVLIPILKNTSHSGLAGLVKLNRNCFSHLFAIPTGICEAQHG